MVPGGHSGSRFAVAWDGFCFSHTHGLALQRACQSVSPKHSFSSKKQTNKQANKQGCMGRGREQLSSCRSRLENVSQHLCPVPPEFPTAAVDSADVEVISLSPRSQYVVAFASRGRRLRPAYCSHRKSRPASPSGPDRGLSGRRPRGPQGSLLAVLVILLGSSWKGGGRSGMTSRVPQRASHVFLSSPSFSSFF